MRKFFLIATSVIATFAIPLSPTHAASPTEFTHVADITPIAARTRPMRIILPTTVLQTCAQPWHDIRIFDSTLREVPYAIFTAQQPSARTTTEPLQIVAYSETANSLSLTLAPATDNAITLTAITLFTNAQDFSRDVDIAISSDTQHWTPVTTAHIFDATSHVDVRNTTMTFPEQTARQVRLTIRPSAATPPATEVDINAVSDPDGIHDIVTRLQRTQRFHIDRIMAQVKSAQIPAPIIDELEFPFRSIQQRPKITVGDLGRVNLPITWIEPIIDTRFFSRPASLLGGAFDHPDAYQTIATGTILRVPDFPTTQLRLDLNANPLSFLQLHIQNGDNPPISLRSAHLGYARQELFFIPEAGEQYRVFVGNNTLAAPNYEMPALISRNPLERERYPLVTLETLTPNPDFTPPEHARQYSWQRVLLTTLVLMLVVVLGVWCARLIRDLETHP